MTHPSASRIVGLYQDKAGDWIADRGRSLCRGGPGLGEAGWFERFMDRLPPGGRVRLLDGDKLIRRADVVNGKATLQLSGRALKPGYHQLRVVYVGDGTVATSAGPVTRVGVAKAVPRKVLVDVKGKRVVARRTQALLAVRVRPPVGFDSVSGVVRITIGGKSTRRTLDDGRATLRMNAFRSTFPTVSSTPATREVSAPRTSP